MRRKKAQLEAAYKKAAAGNQPVKKISSPVIKARVSTRNMAMSRQKKLDKMNVIELAAQKPKPEFHLKQGALLEIHFEAKICHRL